MANDSQDIIVLADRMLTSYDNTLCFELDGSKIEKLFENSVALTAGAATLHQSIYQGCQAEIREKSPLISDVAAKIKEKYQEIRNMYLSDQVFTRRGLTLESFYKMQHSLHEGTIADLNNYMDQYVLPLQMLVAGVDELAHIYMIGDPGILIPLDSLGFACIGTGTRHAEVTFAYRKYSKKLDTPKALYIAFEAKKRAEMAGGVGQTTDIMIASKGCGFRIVKDNIISQLEEIYKSVEEQSGYGKDVDEAIGKIQLD